MNFFNFFKSRKKISPFTRDHFNFHHIHIEDYTYGLPVVKDWGEGKSLFIGKYCSIADDVLLMLGGNHRLDWVSTYPFNAFNQQFPKFKNITGHPASKGDIKIGNDVWIGNGVTILSGVTIGDGAVIGAKSVVTKSIPPFAIAVGNPARVVRYRFDSESIEGLLKIKWWDWDEEKINFYSELICQPDIKAFVKKFNSLQ
jgi:acetyltransferase-like isoleucine patch superfamily enzyme